MGISTITIHPRMDMTNDEQLQILTSQVAELEGMIIGLTEKMLSLEKYYDQEIKNYRRAFLELREKVMNFYD